jgi:hypothetical protein
MHRGLEKYPDKVIMQGLEEALGAKHGYIIRESSELDILSDSPIGKGCPKNINNRNKVHKQKKQNTGGKEQDDPPFLCFHTISLI